MSHKAFTIPITEVVDLLGLERDPRSRDGASSFNVKCPFCSTARTRKYHMNINVQKNVYFCPKCMDASAGGSGALDLYGRVRLGTPLMPGRNGAELYHKLATELEGCSRMSNHAIRNDKPVVEDICPAENKALDKAYRTLLTLPYLALNRKHGRNLLGRGLDRDTIEEGLYASFPAAESVLANHEKADKVAVWYDKYGCESYRKSSPILRYYKKEDLLVGLLIASDVLHKGAKLDNVPGFFKLKGAWCFRYDYGMAIPTVAIDGNIVGIQVRRDVATEKGLRYMTLSSKDLDCGVTTGIARTHVATDHEIDENTAIFITEGPLKANIILHLLRGRGASNIAVIAIQGVNNTKELPAIAKILTGKGVKEIMSAFDMDKTGNLAVARAAGNVKKIFTDAGLKVQTLCWDAEYAKVKYAELAALCKKNAISVPQQCGDIYKDVHSLAVLLNSKGIEYNVKWVNGKKYKDHWREKSKGMDDYLSNYQ